MPQTPPPVTRRTMIGTAIRACAALSLGAAGGGFSARRVAWPVPWPPLSTTPPLPPGAAHPPSQAHPPAQPPHPEPRPGIDASHMPASDTVRRANAEAVAAFDEARTIPEILDGIRCQCGCSGQEGMRSLLSCYEGDEAMALQCHVCQGEARLAYRMKGKGRSLDQIRAAIDARYGG